MILSTDAIKHRKLLVVSFSYLAEIFKSAGEHIAVFRGIPKDARLLGVSVNAELEAVEFLFEHPDFPKILDCVLTTASDIDSLAICPTAFCEDCQDTWRGLVKEFMKKDEHKDE